jgi:cytochrome c-type biogenesis protein CcmH/NrfF
VTRGAARRVALAAGIVVSAGASARVHAASEPAHVPTTAAESAASPRVARPASLQAADTALESLTRSVAAQLRCPVCQGLSLADSPSELALEMKDVVREQLAAGRTPDEVKAYFVAKYGEWILLEPPRRGVNLLAYLLPAGALAGGLGVIWLVLRRWTSGGPPVVDEVPEPEPVD